MAIRKTFGNKDAETPKKGQKILMNTLEKSRKTNEFLRGESRNPSGGTKAPKGDRAMPQRGRGSGGTRPPGGGPIRPAQKGGLPSPRGTTSPVEYKKPGTSVTEYKKPGTSMTEYKKPGKSVAEYKSPGRSVTTRPSNQVEVYKPKPSLSGTAAKKAEGLLEKAQRLAKGPLGLAGATAGFYFGDTFSSRTGNQANYGEQAWIDDKNNRGPLMKGNRKYDKAIGPDRPKTTKLVSGPRDDRASDTRADTSPVNKAKVNKAGGTSNGPLKSPYAQISFQGQKPKKKKFGADKPIGSTGGKPSSSKMTNFERMKMRGYEKEGFGGRAMTSSGAKARVQKERSYKFKDLFKKK